MAVASDTMGEGDPALGKILMKGFLYALSQMDTLPETILFYNGGVMLTTEGSESLEDLKAMEAEKVGQVENVSIDGNTEFEKDQIFQVDAKVVISYHVYAKCTVNVHINFIPNLMFRTISGNPRQFNYRDESAGVCISAQCK